MQTLKGENFLPQLLAMNQEKQTQRALAHIPYMIINGTHTGLATLCNLQ